MRHRDCPVHYPVPALSVILCSHNPRADYLERTLHALRAQTLSTDEWEFLLIDNRSKEPLRGRVDLEWHPEARIVREEKLGLTHSRLRGHRECSGELIVFVDDDNVLAPDYLATALEIHRQYPLLGSFGGSITAEFEIPPPRELQLFLPALALRTVEQRHWSNYDGACEPFGAGMCVTHECMTAFVEWARNEPRLANLGRTGAGLGSCEDNAIARAGRTHGLGWGLFPELKLTHLIAAHRLKRDYLERLVENIRAYSILLIAIEYGPYCEPKQSRGRRIFSRLTSELELRLSSAPYRALKRAEQRGDRKGRELVKKIFGPPKK